MTAKQCCCCFELRTGNLIIAWLDVLGLLAIFAKSYYSGLVMGFIGILGLYAIFKEKPEFLWPSMICRVLGVIYASIVLIMLLIGHTYSETQAINDHGNASEVETMQLSLIDMEISLFIMIGFQCYLLYVVISYYKQMKQEIVGKSHAKPFDNVERGLYPNNRL